MANFNGSPVGFVHRQTDLFAACAIGKTYQGAGLVGVGARQSILTYRHEPPNLTQRKGQAP